MGGLLHKDYSSLFYWLLVTCFLLPLTILVTLSVIYGSCSICSLGLLEPAALLREFLVVSAAPRLLSCPPKLPP